MSRTMRLRLGGGGTALVVVGALVFVGSGAVQGRGRLGQVLPVPVQPAGAAAGRGAAGSARALPLDVAGATARPEGVGIVGGPSPGGAPLGGEGPEDARLGDDLRRPGELRPGRDGPASRGELAPPTLADPAVPFTTTPSAVPLTPVSLPSATPPADPATLAELGWGDEGDMVSTLQRRLAALGFRATEADGHFGEGTWSAVLAFQKFEGLERTGSVTTEVWQRLYRPQGLLPPPQRTTAPKVEVDLDRQVLFVLNADHPGQVAILNTSTGGGYYYTNKDGSSDFAYTPEGDFRVYRRYDGLEVAPLGTLYRPLYFVGGWAVHGSPSVPEYPASHGCVRLSNDDADWLWDRAPDDMAVTVRATMDPALLSQQAWDAWVTALAEAPSVAGA